MKSIAFGALGALAIIGAFMLGAAWERQHAAPASVASKTPPYVTTQNGRYAFVVGGDDLWRIDTHTGKTEHVVGRAWNLLSEGTIAIPEGWMHTSRGGRTRGSFQYYRLGGTYPDSTARSTRP